MKTFTFQHTAKGWSKLPRQSELDSEKTLILCFFSPRYSEKPEVFAELKKLFPKSTHLGCSTSGEIFQDQICDESASCIALSFSDARLKTTFHTIESSSHSKVVGANIGKSLLAPDLKGILVFSDGLLANGSALAEGLNSVVDTNKVAISGGLAGDGSDFKNTFLSFDGKILSKTVCAVGLYGDNLSIATASKGGWDIFGPERIITKSKDNIVYEIDDRPALDLYKEYLGDKAKDLPASGLLFPIQIRDHNRQEKRLVRTILSVDEATKSLTFAGNVPEGCLAQLMRANFDRVIDGATDAAQLVFDQGKESLPDGHDGVSACIAVSCVGRRLVLGARSEEEIETLQASLGVKTQIAGFYSYGELAPSGPGSPCELHNQSMTLMRIAEFNSQKAKGAA